MNIDISSNQTLLELTLFALTYSIQDNNAKRLKLENITFQKELLIIITSSSMEKTFLTNTLILI